MKPVQFFQMIPNSDDMIWHFENNLGSHNFFSIKPAKRAYFFLKGDMWISCPEATPCPDIWDDRQPELWINNSAG